MSFGGHIQPLAASVALCHGSRSQRVQCPNRRLGLTLTPATGQPGRVPRSPGFSQPPSHSAVSALENQTQKAPAGHLVPPPNCRVRMRPREANGLARGRPVRASWPQAGPRLTCSALKCHIRSLLVITGRRAVPTPQSRPTPRPSRRPSPFHACPRVDGDEGL